MKKFKLSKKLKFLIGLTSFAAVAVILPSTLLTSCSSSANPYGPYSVIGSKSDIDSGSAMLYSTKDKSYTLWNGNGTIIPNSFSNGEYKNKWITSKDLLSYYESLAKTATQDFLTPIKDKTTDAKMEQTNSFKTIVSLYAQDPKNVSAQEKEHILNYMKNGWLSAAASPFFYGVKPTAEMKKIVKLYNEMTIKSNIFTLVTQISNELLSYSIASEFSEVYNWLSNGQPKAQDNPLAIPVAPAPSTATPAASGSTSTPSSTTPTPVSKTSGTANPTGSDGKTPVQPKANMFAMSPELQDQPIASRVDKSQRAKNAQNFANTSVMQLLSQIQNNGVAKEMAIGMGNSLGQGSHSYNLWPSGFSAKIKIVNKDGQTVNLNGDNINDPYSMINDGKAPTQYTVEVSDITVNYQWYRSGKVGGEYVTANNGSADINKYLDDQQKLELSYSGLANEKPGDFNTGYIHNVAYQLPIANLNFNLAPMTEGYSDPIYPLLKDFVYNGIYTIQPSLIYKGGSSVDNKIKVPEQLKSRGTHAGVNWQVINSTAADINSAIPYGSEKDLADGKAKLSIGKSLIEEIRKNPLIKKGDLHLAPYYYSNATGWTANTSENNGENYEAALTLAGNDTAGGKVSNLLTYYQTRYLLGMFQNLYGTPGTMAYNMPVFNNFNSLNRFEFMNMWSLGWMLENAQNSSDYKAKGYTGAKVQTNEIDPAKTMEFKAIQDQLMKMSVSQFAHNKANAAAVATYKKGLEQFYKIVNISKTTTGLTYSYDSQNGKISYHSAAVTVDPNKATDKTNKTAVVNGQDTKKPVTAKDTTQK